MGIFSGIAEKFRSYVDMQLRLLKLNVIGQVSVFMGSFVFVMLALFVFCVMLLFSGFGLAEVFADNGLSRAESFFAVTGIYFLGLVLLLLGGRSIRRYFADVFIKAVTENDPAEGQS